MSSLVRGPVAETLRTVVPETWTVQEYMTEPDRLDKPVVMLDHKSYAQSDAAAGVLEAAVSVFILMPTDKKPSAQDRPEQTVEDAVDDATGIVVWSLMRMELVLNVTAERTMYAGNPCWKIDLTLVVPINEDPEESE